ncbi:MAG: peptidoglycan editing factor PgeF [Lachnospiraceae bacterium]|nr:peptidoglycan editing factor PgeF [Lachnospiraceae bacterium]
MLYDHINRKKTGLPEEKERIFDYYPVRKMPAGEENVLPVLVSPLLDAIPGITHCFTTREGGVSKGIFRSLNLSFNRGDERAAVEENFRRVAAAFGSTPDRILSTDQTHTANIRVASEEDAGKGVIRPKDYTDVDGLVTNVPGLILGVYIADCVPVLIADPVSGAVGAIHSGWRGTAEGIAGRAVRLMQEQFGSRAEDLICAVGPSICKDCYEVSKDVAERFEERLGHRAAEAVFYKGLSPEGEPKYLADLWQSNRIVLEEAGVLPSHISVTDVCTSCNSEFLFSHRASRGKRGNLGAFIMTGHK